MPSNRRAKWSLRWRDAEVEIRRVADCHGRQLAEVGQLLPRAFVVGVLQARNDIEVVQQKRGDVAGLAGGQIQMRHPAAGANRQRISQELRQAGQRVLARRRAEGNRRGQRCGSRFAARIVAGDAADRVKQRLAAI